MFLQPNQKKYKKERKGIISGIVFESLNSGTYGIVSLGCAKINARQIEMARRVISRRIKSIGKLWIRILPSKPITAKPNEVRMGKGKGSVSYWVAEVRPGKVLYEISGINRIIALKIWKILSLKLPIKISLRELNSKLL